MITNTFDLLADTRQKLAAILSSVDAKREFYLADAGLMAAVYGGGESAPDADAETEIADAGDE